MRVIEATKHTRTYVSKESAIAAVELLGEKFGPLLFNNLTVVVSKAPNGRFFPVLFLRGQALQYAAMLAGAGFHAIG